MYDWNILYLLESLWFEFQLFMSKFCLDGHEFNQSLVEVEFSSVKVEHFLDKVEVSN